jgi:hypothetical protein
MNESSRVQNLLNEQNSEINRLKNYVKKLEATLREIGLEAPSTCFGYCSKKAREAMKGKNDASTQ